MITTILNVFRRPQYLKKQIEHIRAQTVSSEIWAWVNGHDENDHIDFSEYDLDQVFVSNNNLKFYPRFAVALLATTEYVAVFDDDTMPGNLWFENCLNTMKTHEGILGGTGVSLVGNYYNGSPHTAGWRVYNEHPVEVDLVGHAWFFKREWLQYLWKELPATLENGEDIQLSYLAQKYGGLKTYCPPHPKNNLQMSSSLCGVEYGDDSKASYKLYTKDHASQRDFCVSNAIENGWRPLFMR